jgi:DNA-binding winged helix-turn-helix (wHTH) protein
MKFSFGDCVLDSSARQLVRAGQVVPLEPKMYELLETLISRRATVVTNNELDEILWPDVYVARTSLTRLVSRLRAVLGDSPHDSRIIRTVYKTGYSFCGEVTCMGGSGKAAADAPAALSLLWNNQRMPLPDGEHIAGRDARCSLVVDADTVSRRHARITVISGTATIEDLGSTNGTQVNGQRICVPTRLAAGNEIALGNEILRVSARIAALTVRTGSDQQASSASPGVRRK